VPCFHPQRVWYSKYLNPSGKRNIVFNQREALSPGDHFDIACSQCVGCRLERSRQWAMRCMHEAKMHKNNCFVTLTYADGFLPPHNSLHYPDFQKFLKRHRFHHGTLRYYMCGEYGDRTQRPHYHACLFGVDYPDKVHYKTINGNRLYTSKILDKKWKHGFAVIGDLTFDSAAYVARYVMKKQTGKNAVFHYNTIDFATGEITQERTPEFNKMSLKPAIAWPWLDKYGDYVQAHDFVIVNGKKVRPAKYYDRVFQATRPYEFDEVKERRTEKAKQLNSDNHPYRLAVKEEVLASKIKLLKRTVD
jgi:hypothetical protein